MGLVLQRRLQQGVTHLQRHVLDQGGARGHSERLEASMALHPARLQIAMAWYADKRFHALRLSLPWLPVPPARLS